MASPIQQIAPEDIFALLGQRDGAAQVIPKLRDGFHPKDQEPIWDACGQYYSAQGRQYEALSIYQALYEQYLQIQEPNESGTGARVHKGTPLVRIADAHQALNHPVLAKRFMMLTLCEDALNNGGTIPSETTGTYFRTVWHLGITHEQVARYASQAWALWREHPNESRFPEWILQELDQDWMTEYPTSREAAIYVANEIYVRYLLSKLGSGSGKELERIAHYLLSCVPGFRARMRARSSSTDYDVMCAVEGSILDFRSELGRYFLCECKDWSKASDVTTVVKFAAVLRSAKCRFGILFSKEGITGANETKYAERELLKIFQQDDLTILVITRDDLNEVVGRASFLTLLRTKYERVRFDLPETVSK